MNIELKYEAFRKSGWNIDSMNPLEVSYDENFANYDFVSVIIGDRIKEIIEVVVSQEIDDWHKRNEESTSLHDYLDFSWEEYQLYTKNNIIPSTKKEQLLNKFIKNPDKYLDEL